MFRIFSRPDALSPKINRTETCPAAERTAAAADPSVSK